MKSELHFILSSITQYELFIEYLLKSLNIRHLKMMSFRRYPGNIIDKRGLVVRNFFLVVE